MARQYIHDNGSFQRQARLWTGMPSPNKTHLHFYGFSCHKVGLRAHVKYLMCPSMLMCCQHVNLCTLSFGEKIA